MIIIVAMKFIHLAWTESHIGTSNSETLEFTDDVDAVHDPVQVQEGVSLELIIFVLTKTIASYKK